MIVEAIEKLKEKAGLSGEEMEEVFTEIMSGKSDADTIASFLLLLKEKGETVEEITAAACVMRKFAVKIRPKKDRLLDTCGTGGDNAGTFNISTVAAFVACGAGAVVAKHGNRFTSSKCGSADLIEELGVKLDVDNKTVERAIEEVGIGFLFAPKMHLAMKYAMPARKQIKTRSIFNILGPLTNPAGAKFQLLGVYDKKLVRPIAEVLRNLGSEGVMIVHGEDGQDEITTTDETFIAELKDGVVETYFIKPEDFGLNQAKKEDLTGGDKELNAKIALEILNGAKGAKRDITVLNAGAAIYVCGLAGGMKEGIKKAEESIDSGKALEKLKMLKKFTNGQRLSTND